MINPLFRSDTPKVRFGKTILSKGELLSVQVDIPTNYTILKIVVESVDEDNSQHIYHSDFDFDVEGYEHIHFILDTALVPPGMYEMKIVWDNNSTSRFDTLPLHLDENEFYKQYTFSVVKNRTLLVDAFKAMFEGDFGRGKIPNKVKEANFESEFSFEEAYRKAADLRSSDIELLYNAWNVPFKPELYKRRSKPDLQRIFLEYGIWDFINAFFNSADEEIHRKFISSTSWFLINIDLPQFVWLLKCFSEIIKELVNISDEIKIHITQELGNITLLLSTELNYESRYYDITREEVIKYPEEGLLNKIITDIIQSPLLEAIMEMYGELLNISASYNATLAVHFFMGDGPFVGALRKL